MNSRDSIERRLLRLRAATVSPEARAVELELCRRSAQHWFDNWCWTFDPRLSLENRSTYIPLDFWPRQRALLTFLEGKLKAREEGAVAKSRDIGFTWIAGGLAVHRWLFEPGFKTTFGSRKEEYVDARGDPDSIFEKIRILLRGLPPWMMPAGFTWREHDNYMRLVNPGTDAMIRGEAGENMGRGGRSTWYVVDEAAFIQGADSVDAATSGNTDCRLWASSANGPGNLFFRKWHDGSLREDQKFLFHYTDDPRKVPEWVVKKKREMQSHSWASEYEIDFSASVEGICIPAAWVKACQEIAKHIDVQPTVTGIAGQDVGAGGKGKSVFVARFGPVVRVPVSWGDGDTINTAHRALKEAQDAEFTRADGYVCKVKRLLYDSVGVGRGVQDTLKRSITGVATKGINVGSEPSDRRWPDGKTSRELFFNLKAEGWFLVRDRAKCTYEMWLHLTGQEGGVVHSADELLVLPPNSAGPDAQALAMQLSLPKSEATEKGKVMIEKKADLARRGIASPDHAEGLVLTFCDSSVLDVMAAIGRRAA